MSKNLQDSSKLQEFPHEVNEKDSPRLRIVILPVLAALAFLGSFQWDSEPESPRQTANEAVRSAVESATPSLVSPTLVEPSTTRQPKMQRVKLAITPSEATYPLGESNSLFVKMAAAPTFSRGVVTLVYDPEIIEVTNVHPFAAKTPFTVSPRIENLQGWVIVSLAPTGTASEQETEGELFTVEFKPIAEGRSDMVLMEARFIDGRGLSVPVEVNNGGLTVAAREYR